MAKKNWVKELEESGMIRIDWMIPLMAQSPSELMQDAVAEMGWPTIKKVFNAGGYVKELYMEGNYRDICDWISVHRYGQFLCYVTTPIVSDRKSFSWGYTYRGYILADSLEDATEKSFEWKKNIENKNKGRKR